MQFCQTKGQAWGPCIITPETTTTPQCSIVTAQLNQIRSWLDHSMSMLHICQKLCGQLSADVMDNTGYRIKIIKSFSLNQSFLPTEPMEQIRY